MAILLMLNDIDIGMPSTFLELNRHTAYKHIAFTDGI